MSTKLEQFLQVWRKPYIREQDLLTLFKDNETQRYDAVKYALTKGLLVKIRRGLYLTKLPSQILIDNTFELAQVIYGPSYISLESALSYHGWIPEGVYITTSVTSRRSQSFQTPVGQFTFSHTPILNFYSYVTRIETTENTFLIANPWKAIADYIYLHKKKWKSRGDLQSDLRIEYETLQKSDIDELAEIAKYYHSNKVRQMLTIFLKDIKNGHKNY